MYSMSVSRTNCSVSLQIQRWIRFKPGKYLLLGDNLVLHVNLKVIKIAEQNLALLLDQLRLA